MRSLPGGTPEQQAYMLVFDAWTQATRYDADIKDVVFHTEEPGRQRVGMIEETRVQLLDSGWVTEEQFNKIQRQAVTNLRLDYQGLYSLSKEDFHD